MVLVVPEHIYTVLLGSLTLASPFLLKREGHGVLCVTHRNLVGLILRV